MGMTRRDYELIANAVNNLWNVEDTDPYTIEEAAHELAIALSHNNPRFDSDRFIYACGVAL